MCYSLVFIDAFMIEIIYLYNRLTLFSTEHQVSHADCSLNLPGFVSLLEKVKGGCFTLKYFFEQENKDTAINRNYTPLFRCRMKTEKQIFLIY